MVTFMALSILQRDLIQTLLLSPSCKQSDSPQVKAEHKLCGLGMTIIQLAETETFPLHYFAGIDISDVSNCTFSHKTGEYEHSA